jgi:hypothetical protein
MVGIFPRSQPLLEVCQLIENRGNIPFEGLSQFGIDNFVDHEIKFSRGRILIDRVAMPSAQLLKNGPRSEHGLHLSLKVLQKPPPLHRMFPETALKLRFLFHFTSRPYSPQA